ncbi:MAG: ferrous iron transport protein A [Flavobacteriia bacterium]|jgi:ferrous iron transport protein A|nr:ferrous iron transport protein A [Flavobacteriia bacterium]
MMLLLHMSQTLDAISLNELVEIAAISNDAIAPKLSEMGLTKGQKIKAIFKAPFGDPIAYEINGNVISMRKEEAMQVEVQMA